MTGLLLAAGAGRRYGGPKALVRDDEGTAWVRRRARTLADGGCARVIVVTGAQSRAVQAELEGLDVDTVRAAGWEEGMGASLRAGLVAASSDGRLDAVLVALVDTPGLTPQVVARLVTKGSQDALVQACYDGEPGHPVLIGERHLRGVVDVAEGDRGAREYLRSHLVELVECGDVGSGEDVDEPGPGRPTLGS